MKVKREKPQQKLVSAQFAFFFFFFLSLFPFQDVGMFLVENKKKKENNNLKFWQMRWETDAFMDGGDEVLGWMI